MKFLFYDNGLVYDGKTLVSEPLGGSESALIYVTKELAKLGHDVHVYNNCSCPGRVDNVTYHSVKEMEYAMEYIKYDVFISLRTFQPFNFFLNADVNVYWAQDDQLQPAMQQLRTDELVRRNIDLIMTISDWQTWTYNRWFSWPYDKFFITRNGVDEETYKQEPNYDKKRRLTYTSTPLRGLELLLELFPLIKKKVTDVELDVFSSFLVYQEKELTERDKCKKVFAMLEQDGVHQHGSVTKAELSKALYETRLLSYPNTFLETGCIAAMEAQAAGNAVVSSRQGALPETCLRGGCLIEGVPYSGEYKQQFVDRCTELLLDDEKCCTLARSGREHIMKFYTWKTIANEWSRFFEIVLEQKKTAIRRYRRLELHGVHECNERPPR